MVVPIFSDPEEIVQDAASFGEEISKKMAKGNELSVKLGAIGCGSDSVKIIKDLNIVLQDSYNKIQKRVMDDCTDVSAYKALMAPCLVPFKRLQKQIKIAQAVGNAAQVT